MGVAIGAAAPRLGFQGALHEAVACDRARAVRGDRRRDGVEPERSAHGRLIVRLTQSEIAGLRDGVGGRDCGRVALARGGVVAPAAAGGQDKAKDYQRQLSGFF